MRSFDEYMESFDEISLFSNKLILAALREEVIPPEEYDRIREHCLVLNEQGTTNFDIDCTNRELADQINKFLNQMLEESI